MKHYWNEAVANFQREDVNVPITRKEVAPLLDHALKRVPSRAIVNGSRACGLYPLSPYAVNYSKCLKLQDSSVMSKKIFLKCAQVQRKSSSDS